MATRRFRVQDGCALPLERRHPTAGAAQEWSNPPSNPRAEGEPKSNPYDTCPPQEKDVPQPSEWDGDTDLVFLIKGQKVEHLSQMGACGWEREGLESLCKSPALCFREFTGTMVWRQQEGWNTESGEPNQTVFK